MPVRLWLKEKHPLALQVAGLTVCFLQATIPGRLIKEF